VYWKRSPDYSGVCQNTSGKIKDTDSCTQQRSALLTVIIFGNVFNDVMDMRSFKQSAQDNPPDDIDLVLKRYMDNQSITLIIISYFFLRNILTLNTELKHILL
jgi:hypothetical protein